MTSTTAPDSEIDAQLSEQQLRQIYDEEEAEHFLRFFSTKYVTEVWVQHDPNEGTDQSSISSEESLVGAEAARSLSETIALNFIAPLLLPASTPSPPPFTINRCLLTVQRLYLALEPLYYPSIVDKINLATWTNKSRSMKYCLIFWMLWWHNLLLPSLLLRILYFLIRRKIFTYPTYAELLERRRQVDNATEIGKDVSAQLTGRAINVTDSWKILKLCLSLARRNPDRDKAKTATGDPDVGQNQTASDDIEDRKRDEDMKRDALHLLNQIADFHERIKNIFIWRAPTSSNLYAILIFSLALITYFTPAQYLVKSAYFCCGFLFWHIMPVIAALPPRSLSRMPPPFASVPTDAEHAMRLISSRVATGSPLTPPALPKRPNAQAASEDQKQGDSDSVARSLLREQVDWSKWGNRLAEGKSWATQHRQSTSGGKESNSAAPHSSNTATGQSHAYPAQYRSTTGLLTVTSSSLYFTPIISTDATIEMPFAALKSVRKSDLLKVKGLRVFWTDAASNNAQKEVHFVWVGGRDELFARLVGYGSGRWLKV